MISYLYRAPIIFLKKSYRSKEALSSRAYHIDNQKIYINKKITVFENEVYFDIG